MNRPVRYSFVVAPQYPPDPNRTAYLARADGRRPRTGILLKGLGLVAVAVVAGLVWYLIRHDSSPEPAAQAPAKEFSFAATEGPVASTDCVGKSTDKIKSWFGTHPCQGLRRALFTTTAGGSKALVSVALVTMSSTGEAQALKGIVDTDGTGNVRDLVDDGTAKITGAPDLKSGEYASRTTGTQVTIVLSAFFDGHDDKATLGRMSAAALDLSSQLG